jgi:hypothetical protein
MPESYKYNPEIELITDISELTDPFSDFPEEFDKFINTLPETLDYSSIHLKEFNQKEQQAESERQQNLKALNITKLLEELEEDLKRSESRSESGVLQEYDQSINTDSSNSENLEITTPQGEIPELSTVIQQITLARKLRQQTSIQDIAPTQEIPSTLEKITKKLFEPKILTGLAVISLLGGAAFHEFTKKPHKLHEFQASQEGLKLALTQADKDITELLKQNPNAEIRLRRAQNAHNSKLTYYPAKSIQKILKYNGKQLTAQNGKKIIISPLAVAFAIGVAPTESDFDQTKIGGVSNNNPDLRCHGLFQLCKNQEGGNTFDEYLGKLGKYNPKTKQVYIPNPKEYRENLDLQMMIAQMAVEQKYKISQKFASLRNKSKKEGILGEAFGVGSAWLGLCPDPVYNYAMKLLKIKYPYGIPESELKKLPPKYPKNLPLKQLTRSCGGGVPGSDYGNTFAMNTKSILDGELLNTKNALIQATKPKSKN